MLDFFFLDANIILNTFILLLFHLCLKNYLSNFIKQTFKLNKAVYNIFFLNKSIFLTKIKTESKNKVNGIFWKICWRHYLSYGLDNINEKNVIVMNMIRDQRLSSSLRWSMASRMRFISFFPLCSPCLTFIFVMTLRHPASTLSLASSSFAMPSFLIF